MSTVGGSSYDVVVVGAGCFGAWTAWHLRAAGKRVLLVDQYGPANARASSGGESRVIRMSYGPDELYTRFSWRSLALWKALFADVGRARAVPEDRRAVDDEGRGPERDGEPARARRVEDPARAARRATSSRRRYPADRGDPRRLGDLRARERRPAGAPRGAGGGRRRPARAAPSTRAATCCRRRARAGSTRSRPRAASRCAPRPSCFACGPWLGNVAPRRARRPHLPDAAGGLLLRRAAGRHALRPARDADLDRLRPGLLRHARPREPRLQDRERPARPRLRPRRGRARADGGRRSREARAFLAQRFPGMRGAPLVEARVCQYENTSNGDFVIDRHPGYENVWLAGAARATASSTARRSASTRPSAC